MTKYIIKRLLASVLVLWGVVTLVFFDTDINFHNNTVYNPRRLYFIEQTNGTNIFFKEKDYIKSDYNTYLLTEEATIFRDSYKIAEKDEFISEYKKDANSTFLLIEVDNNIINVATTSNEINEIKRLFKTEEEQEPDDATGGADENNKTEQEPDDTLGGTDENNKTEQEPDDTTGGADNTVINAVLPYTGTKTNNAIIAIMIILIACSVRYYIRYSEIK